LKKVKFLNRQAQYFFYKTFRRTSNLS
jgi:hypothetical protein